MALSSPWSAKLLPNIERSSLMYFRFREREEEQRVPRIAVPTIRNAHVRDRSDNGALWLVG
jgi:hypothetical protein